MNELKHTPGPWEATPKFSCIGKRTGIGYMDMVADLRESPFKFERRQNALLIAAAPDMFKLIKEFCMHIKTTTHRQKNFDEKALEIIKKVEGE